CIKETNSIEFWKPLFTHQPFLDAIQDKYRIPDKEITDGAALEDLYSDDEVEPSNKFDLDDDIPDDVDMSEE
ncbi:hypothetical protein ACXWOQ_09400, partial [Streptococcus pyogenes]